MVEMTASPPPDIQLVAAAQRNKAQFARLYRRYVTKVYRYLYVRLRDSAEAEDLTAQVFTEALEKLHTYREQGSFAGWLFTLARRRLIDHYRRRRPTLALNAARNVTDGTDVPGAVTHNQQLERLTQLVQQLDADQQELLSLRFAAELTYADIGAAVGKSEAAVKMAIRRLLNQLEAQWEATHV